MKTLWMCFMLAAAAAGFWGGAAIQAQVTPAPTGPEVKTGIDEALQLIAMMEGQGSIGDAVQDRLLAFHDYALSLPAGAVKDAAMEVDMTGYLLQLAPLVERLFDTPGEVLTVEEHDLLLDWMHVLRSVTILAELAQGH